MRVTPILLAAALTLLATPAFAGWPSFTTDLPPSGNGEGDAAVIVGIGDYLVLPDIEGARENALDWNRYLQKTRGLPMGSVKMLLNTDATKETIEAALVDAVSKVKPGGTMWFVYIGHGAPAPSHEDGLVLGSDTQSSENSLVARGLPQKRILEILETGAQSQAVALFDACFSGTTGDGKTQLVPNSQATIPVRRIEVSEGRTAILSASDLVAGPLPQDNRPAFSYLMLGSMRGWADKNKDHVVQLTEAFDYTREILITFIKGRSQVPSLRGKKDVLLALGAVEAGPDLVSMQADLGPVEDMFKSASLTAPTIDPKLFSSAGGLSGSMDIGVEKARDAAMAMANNTSAAAESKRDAWCKLAEFTTEKNHYRAEAEKLCANWKKYIEDEAKILANLGNDYDFLVDYLTLDRTGEQKQAAMRSFIDVYGKYAARQEVVIAKQGLDKLSRGEPAGLQKDEDHDGMMIDACPFEAEDMDGDVDDDGCPETTAAENLGKGINDIGRGVGDIGKSIDDAGFHLYLLSFDTFRLDLGAHLGFGLWDEPLVPTKFDQLAFRPIAAATTRLTWGPLEGGLSFDWDLSRDLEDGGGYMSAHGGARVFGIGPWTPSVGVEYRDVLSGKGNLGVYLANSFYLFEGLAARLTYRYGLDQPGGIVPVHAVFFELNLLLLSPGGSAVGEILEEVFEICD